MSLKPTHATATVTTAGTRVQVTSTRIFTPLIYFEASHANTGFIYIGDVTVSSTVYMTRLGPGEWVNINTDWFGRNAGMELDLSKLYVDSSVNGEAVRWTYFQKQDND